MTDPMPDKPDSGRGDIARWTICFAVIVLAHFGAAVAGMMQFEHNEPAASPPAVMIELASLPVAPPSETAEATPGPEQTQTEPAPIEPEPEKAPETVEDTPPEPQPVVEETIPDLVPVQKAEVAVAVAQEPPPVEQKPEPKPEIVKKPKPKPEKKKAAPKPVQTTSAPTAAPRTAQHVASASMASTGSSSAMPNWKSRLVAHLQSHKRYPSEAQSGGHQGTAYLQFTMDRSGRVLSSRLARSSGYSSLDQETLALARRAQPLPPPPADVPGSTFSFSVPLRYNMR